MSGHREKAQVLDEAALDRALTRIAHEIVEHAVCGNCCGKWNRSSF